MTDPDCTTCRSIPRSCSGGRFGDGMPQRAGSLLTPPPPTPDLRDNVTSLHRCPECQASYRYEYSSEQDDLDLFITETLTRLSAVEALGLAVVQSQREALTATWHKSLGHPTPWVRADAAWNLATLARIESDWAELLALLADADPLIQNEGLQALCHSTLPQDTPESVILALRAVAAGSNAALNKSAGNALERWDFVRCSVEDLLSGEAARQARWVPRLWGYLHLLADEERARLVPLLAGPDELLASKLTSALSKSSYEQEKGLGPATCAALTSLLAGESIAGVASAMKILEGNKTALDRSVFVPLDRWIADKRTREGALALLRRQASQGADLSAVVLALIDAMRDPEAKSVARVLGDLLRQPGSVLIFGVLMDALLRGSAPAGAALLTRSSGTDELVPHEPALRALLARTPSGGPLQQSLVALLVRISLRRPDGLREWLFHPDLAVTGAACMEASYYDVDPWFDRLVSLAPTCWSAASWLLRWGMRRPDNGRRLLAALPTSPQRSLETDWRRLAPRAR